MVNCIDYMTPNIVAGRVLTFIFGPFLTFRVFREFFGSICRFYRHGPNFQQNFLKFCMKLAKNDAKLAYFLNGGQFLALNGRKTNAGPWPKK